MTAPGQDTIDITVLPDGRLKVETDAISPANHMAADNFMKFLQENGLELASATKKKTHRHKHTQQVEAHVHNGEAHTQ